MQKIIVRNKIVVGASSRFIMSIAEHEFLTLDEYITFYGDYFLLTNIFKEEKETIDIINNEYIKVKSSGESKLFSIMYKLDDEFALSITEHIELFHLEEQFNICGKNLTDWSYANSAKYLGDTWWFKDNEILNDIINLSIVEFIKKYKGY